MVEDHWANRQLLVRLLQPLGFEVREAENGQAAIEVWQTFAPQLIWMDMRMPVMDGFQATQHIKATTQGQATAIIALTASSFEQDRSVILSAGCDGFMRKPFREEAIFDMLTQHLGAQFVYTEPDAPVVKDTLDAQSLRAEMQKLAPASLAQLAEGAELGDMDVIAQAIATIRPQHAALADALTEIADRFEYDTLLNLIRQSAPTQPAQDTL